MIVIIPSVEGKERRTRKSRAAGEKNTSTRDEVLAVEDGGSKKGMKFPTVSRKNRNQKSDWGLLFQSAVWG